MLEHIKNFLTGICTGTLLVTLIVGIAKLIATFPKLFIIGVILFCCYTLGKIVRETLNR